MRPPPPPVCSYCMVRLHDRCIGCLCAHGDYTETAAQALSLAMFEYRRLMVDAVYAEALTHFEVLRAMLPVPVTAPAER